jgi:Zn-dependent peptidase ImmA (M78 family)
MLEELTGVDVATLPLPDDVSGMCLLDVERGTTLVLANSSHPAERQRFTLAHELGHLLFGDGSLVDILDEATSPKERRAHEFARCLLVPPGGLRELRNRLSATGATSPAEHMSTLSRHFGVSSAVINIQLRCEGLEVLDPLESTPVLASRYGWRAEYNAAQTAAAIPKPPARLVRRAQLGYGQGKLGASVLARLLHQSEGEVVAELDSIGVHPAPKARKRNDLESLRSPRTDTAGVVA